MRLTTTDGISIHIRRQGAGPEPILFVHGSFASSRWWMPATALLPPAAFTTYLVDLRGCGDSDRPADPAGYSVERQAHDIAAVVDGLGLTGLHLVGHSLGAAIALTYAADHAHRLRSLTLVSTPSPEGTPTPSAGYDLLARMRDDRGLLAQALAAVMPARPPDPLFQQLVTDAANQAPAAFTASAQALENWRLAREARARLRLPVLLMWGERDQYVERSVQNQLLLSIPGANNLEVFQGCGHSPMLERTEGFVQALLEFIGQDFETYAALRDVGE
ncbi:MAG TPA: alpha/beta hydrolase [Anaerolineae bacterium]|nr:alpha/beta hydrolase [Anaerolineae bacterium]